MLAVRHAIREKFISLHTIFGIGQGAVADGDLGAAARKSRIAQRLQTFHQRWIKPGLLCQLLARAVLLNQTCQLSPHFFRDRFLFSKKILRLCRVFRQIVEFRLRRINEVVIVGFNSAQFAPVEMQARQKCFSVEVCRVHLGFW